jgi:hypothetical protein
MANRTGKLWMTVGFAIAVVAGVGEFTACTSTPPRSKNDKWEVIETPAFGKYSAGVSLKLDAEPTSTGSVLQERTPFLQIDCDDGRTSFWVSAGEKVVEGDSSGLMHTMWIQLDDRPVFFEDGWYQFKRGGRLDAPRPIRFSQQVAGAKLLTLKYTSYSQVVLRFDVRGLSTHLKKVAETCGWKIGVPTGAPALVEIRKVFLDSYSGEEESERMAEEWRQKVQGHTCLQPVERLKDADAILRLDAFDTALTSKDGETLWRQHMGYLEYKPLNRAVGCPKAAIPSAVPQRK